MNDHFKLTVLLFFLLLSSCRSSEELVYLKDALDNTHIKGLPVQSTEHILKAGDILYVSIKSINPEVNMIFNPESHMEDNAGNSYQKYTTPSGAYLYGYEIAPDGNITLPMLGKFKLSEIPLSIVEDVVQRKADEYLKDAIVKVKLLNYKITVMGEVRVPGQYYNYNNSITVLQAIAMANGNTDYAAIDKVMVVRATPDGSKTYILDLTSQKACQSEAYYLHPNDYVIVQPDKLKNLQLNSQAYTIFYTSMLVVVAVLGIVF